MNTKVYINQIQTLKENIEKLDTTEQIGLLHYINMRVDNLKNQISENQNGIFINLSSVDKAFIYHLQYYLDYILAQRKYIDNLETEKDKLKQNFNKVHDNIQNKIVRL